MDAGRCGSGGSLICLLVLCSQSVDDEEEVASTVRSIARCGLHTDLVEQLEVSASRGPVLSSDEGIGRRE